MPSVQVYDTDFGNGNLSPSLDTNGWGAMKLGNSGPSHLPTSTAEPQGLRLSVTATGGPAAIGAYVVLGQGQLPLATRLLLQVEFDQPSAVPPGAGGSGRPEPWAVALNVKFGNEDFINPEPMIPVTCQFNPNGTRLNTPGHLEGDQATFLVVPLDYSHLTPGRMLLEHHFCGIKAPGRYAIGYGSLTLSPPIRKSDQRVYSNSGLSGGEQSWIGALGITLVTLTGSGQITVRLRRFSVATWV